MELPSSASELELNCKNGIGPSSECGPSRHASVTLQSKRLLFVRPHLRFTVQHSSCVHCTVATSLIFANAGEKAKTTEGDQSARQRLLQVSHLGRVRGQSSGSGPRPVIWVGSEVSHMGRVRSGIHHLGRVRGQSSGPGQRSVAD